MSGQPGQAGAVVADVGAATIGVRVPIDYAQRPMLVFWETTRACQLACRHCRASATHGPAARGAEHPAEGRALIDQVAGFGRPYPILVLTGGDCLLRADLFDLVEHATSLGVPVAPVAVGHAAADRRDDRSGSRPAGSRRSRSASTAPAPATHDGVRGDRRPLREHRAAIRALVAAGLTVQVNTTVMREPTSSELADIAALVAGAGAQIWEVFFLVARRPRGRRQRRSPPTSTRTSATSSTTPSQYGFIVRTVEAPFFRRVVTAAPGGRAGHPAARLYRALAARLTASGSAHPRAAPSAHTAATRDGKGILFVAHDGEVYPAGFLPAGAGQRPRSSRWPRIYRDDAAAAGDPRGTLPRAVRAVRVRRPVRRVAGPGLRGQRRPARRGPGLRLPAGHLDELTRFTGRCRRRRG